MSSTVSTQISSLSSATLSAFNTLNTSICSLSYGIYNNTNYIENTDAKTGLIKMVKDTATLLANETNGLYSFSLPASIVMSLQNSDIHVVPEHDPLAPLPITMNYIWFLSGYPVTANGATTYSFVISTNHIRSNTDRTFNFTVFTI
jgi:hypothetical protein